MSLGMRRRAQVLVGLRNDGPASDEEWCRWVALVAAEPTQRLRVLIETHGGGGPDAAQRKLLSRAVARLADYEAALLSDSVIERGILVALSWLGVRTRPFGPRQFDAAIAFLGLSQEEAEWAVATLDELRLEAGIAELVKGG